MRRTKEKGLVRSLTLLKSGDSFLCQFVDVGYAFEVRSSLKGFDSHRYYQTGNNRENQILSEKRDLDAPASI